jgi:putative addiction module component (TIGR02574 family)
VAPTEIGDCQHAAANWGSSSLIGGRCGQEEKNALKNSRPYSSKTGAGSSASDLAGGCQLAKNRSALDNMILEKFPEVRLLTASEKLIFVSELWNDLEEHPSEVPVSREILAELDRRMEHFRQHPEEFTTWEEVKDRILDSRS